MILEAKDEKEDARGHANTFCGHCPGNAQRARLQYYGVDKSTLTVLSTTASIMDIFQPDWCKPDSLIQQPARILTPSVNHVLPLFVDLEHGSVRDFL